MLICLQGRLSANCGVLEVVSASDDYYDYKFIMDTKKLEMTPKWELGVGSQAVSLNRAVELTKNYINSIAKPGRDIQVASIALRRSPCMFSRDSWYYFVELMALKDNVPLIESGLWLGILMDGTLIYPTKALRRKNAN